MSEPRVLDRGYLALLVLATLLVFAALLAGVWVVWPRTAHSRPTPASTDPASTPASSHELSYGWTRRLM